MAKDKYHALVKRLLIAAGWTITHDPLPLEWGEQEMEVDLGAEVVIGAQLGTRKIAVEIKTFLSQSRITAFYNAVGQYMTYARALAQTEPERHPYLALPLAAYEHFFEGDNVGQLFLGDDALRLLVFDPDQQEIVLWNPNPLTPNSSND